MQLKASQHKSHKEKGKTKMSEQEATVPASQNGAAQNGTTEIKSAKNAMNADGTGVYMKVPYGTINAATKFNVRSTYPEKDVTDMIAAISKDGLSTPLEVRSCPDGTSFDLTNGFTRYLALGKLIEAGKWTGPIPILVKDYENEGFALLGNFAENTMRKSLRTYDQAKRCAELEATYKISRKRIAASAGVTDKHIGLMVRCFTKLHPTILAAWQNPEAQAEIPLPTLASWSSLPDDEQLAKYAAYLGPEEGAESDEEDGASADENTAPTAPNKKKIRAMLDSLIEKAKESGDETTKAQCKALKWVLGDIRRLQ